MDQQIAHDLNKDKEERTADIEIKMETPFERFDLKPEVLEGIKKAGFSHPTVMQASAISLGNLKLDLILQSKSGTGKTLIFCTILLNAYKAHERWAQALIITPTREIAIQIEEILRLMAVGCKGFKSVCVIGGVDIMEDRMRVQNASAVVATPGRLAHLIRCGMLNTVSIKLLVLDEVDKLLSGSFQEDILGILEQLPKKHQTICVSATINNYKLNKQLSSYMNRPLTLSSYAPQAAMLLGIKQFVHALPQHVNSALEIQAKLKAVEHIFKLVAFTQCLIFTSTQARAETYCAQLRRKQWACAYISGAQDQAARTAIFHMYKEGKINVLVATDLFSRGIDMSNLNLIINLDMTNDLPTYLHRIGRAGRFGRHGVVVNVLATDKDYKYMWQVVQQSKQFMQLLCFPVTMNVASTVPKRDVWDFQRVDKDAEYFGVFDAELMAQDVVIEKVEQEEPFKAADVQETSSTNNIENEDEEVDEKVDEEEDEEADEEEDEEDEEVEDEEDEDKDEDDNDVADLDKTVNTEMEEENKKLEDVENEEELEENLSIMPSTSNTIDDASSLEVDEQDVLTKQANPADAEKLLNLCLDSLKNGQLKYNLSAFNVCEAYAKFLSEQQEAADVPKSLENFSPPLSLD